LPFEFDYVVIISTFLNIKFGFKDNLIILLQKIKKGVTLYKMALIKKVILNQGFGKVSPFSK
jgi:hypothetical protein